MQLNSSLRKQRHQYYSLQSSHSLCFTIWLFLLRWRWNELRRTKSLSNFRIQLSRCNRLKLDRFHFQSSKAMSMETSTMQSPKGWSSVRISVAGIAMLAPTIVSPKGTAESPKGGAVVGFHAFRQSNPRRRTISRNCVHTIGFGPLPLSRQPLETSVAALTHRCSRLFKKSLIRS